MSSDNLKYVNQSHLDEHDLDEPRTKKVSLYGWDADSLQKRRILVNSSGNIVPSSPSLALKLDDTSTANMTYIGEATPGTAGSAVAWRIKRIDETSGLVITWAEGTSDFDKEWDERLTYTYS